MLKFAGELKYFLERNGIDPRLAKLVIRCDDIETQARIEHAIARELHIQMTPEIAAAIGSKGHVLTINRLRLVITNIDAAKVD